MTHFNNFKFRANLIKIILLLTLLVLGISFSGCSSGSSTNNAATPGSLQLNFNAATYAITLNSTRDLTLTYTGGSTEDILINFTSSNTSVATVAQNNCVLSRANPSCTIKVTGDSIGNATIIATTNTSSATVSTSTQVNVTSTIIPGTLAFVPIVNTVTQNSSRTTKLTLVDSSGVNNLLVNLTSSNQSALTLNTTACTLSTANPSCIITISGLQSGLATIIAAANGYTSLVNQVAIVSAPIPGFLIFSGNDNITVGNNAVETLTLDGSSAINNVLVTFSTNNNYVTISPTTCTLSSTQTTCSIKVTGQQSGFTHVIASATNYLSVYTTIAVTGTSPLPTPSPSIMPFPPKPSNAYVLTIDSATINYSIYRTNNNPAGKPVYYQGTPPYNLQNFSGWNTHISTFSGTGIPPDPMLTISNVSGESACTFNAPPPNTASHLEGAFSVDSNNQTIIVNPDLSSFFNNLQSSPITCSAEVNLLWVTNNQLFKSNTQTITATIYPNNPEVTPNRYVIIHSTGAATLPSNPSYYLPIFLNSAYAPLNDYGRPIYAGYNGGIGQNGSGTEDDLLSITANVNESVTINGLTSETDNAGCLYYPIFSYAGNQGEKIQITIPDSANSPSTAIQVNATWNKYCPATGTNNDIETVSGAIQTKNRFQYGTFQVKMKPSNVSGVNSSFYTFFGDGTIKNPTGGLYNWGYTWHEIDFEFVPGNHPIGQMPVYQQFGFSTPYTSPSTIGSSVSLNVFSPGDAIEDADGADQHHRFCPNPNDPQCLISDFNPYDGAFHTFTMTWTPQEIRYYFDGQLANILPITDQASGTPLMSDSNNNPLLWQLLFNNGGIFDANYQFHPTSPQFISMNFWIPTVQGDFGGVFPDSIMTGTNKIYATYNNVKWSPCVDSGNFETSCSNTENFGKVYDATGQVLDANAQKAYDWEFTQMPNKNTLLTDWMYAPNIGFDSNNSLFVQNGVLLDKQGLELCMMSQWNSMATTGNSSVGCDGNPILPPPSAVSPTNFSQALLVINANFNLTNYAPAIGNTYPEVEPGLPNTYSSPPGFINGGWTATSNNACISGAKNGLSCGSGNGWFADPRVEYMSTAGIYQSTFLYWLNTTELPTPWNLNQTQIFSINGKNCMVEYTPKTLTIMPQGTYNITANVTCR